MSKSSPTRPLSGSSVLSEKQVETLYEIDGMPRENIKHCQPWRSVPTERRALALIDAQERQRRANGVNEYASCS